MAVSLIFLLFRTLPYIQAVSQCRWLGALLNKLQLSNKWWWLFRLWVTVPQSTVIGLHVSPPNNGTFCGKMTVSGRTMTKTAVCSVQNRARLYPCTLQRLSLYRSFSHLGYFCHHKANEKFDTYLLWTNSTDLQD